MSNTRILVVDDEEPIRFALREYFVARGYTVDCAQEIEEAEALINANAYDIVIADLRLTGIHGAEGLELVSYVRERSDARVILLTAYGTNEIERAAYDRGATAFLHKPTPLATVAELVAKLAAGDTKSRRAAC
jgi:DNA-binding response OmpR family regulator